ncbi:MAG: leucine-rich repeat domain-containing protein [Candidatus Poribacteria bacterium]|nr:leucine-rich repeat domain-containing protein [Candidatus Poribacteria bacterium]
MKTLYLTITLFIFLILAFLPNGFAQDAPPEYVVRLIYFIPNDRQPDPKINAKLDVLIKDAQQFYADQMEAHGFNRKTFKFEADENGNALVHHVNGQYDDAYYQNPAIGSGIVWSEIVEQFDISKNIYFLVLDSSNQYLDGTTNEHSENVILGYGGGNSRSGTVLIPAANFHAAIHELGHAFGLQHDSRVYAKRIYTRLAPARDWMITSFCAAEWLDVHRYFNPSQEPINENTSVQMLTPSLAAPPHAIRLQFEVTDPDGLHQAQLFRPFGDYPSVIACKQLDGQRATIKFVTTDLIDGNTVALRVMDVNGNFTGHSFPINITDLLPQPEEILFPDPNLASAVREALGLSPSDIITQIDMLRLTHFGVPERQITNLTGLEHAIRLRWLALGRNQIHDITPLSTMKELKQLYLRENKISHIQSVTELTQLEELHISENLIRDITPLEVLSELISLVVRDNPVRNITSLAALTNLEYLDLTNIQISDISPLAGLGHLEHLRVNKIPVTDITPLAALTQLKTLNMHENRLSDVRPLAELKKLQGLGIVHNQISDIDPLAELRQLQSLDLRLNQIDDISPLAELEHLQSLDISKNQISDISPLTELKKLQLLGLAENQIGDISPLTGLKDLHWLGLVQNQISDISPLTELKKLRMLALGINRISDVRPLTGLINLEFLNLMANPIKNRDPLFALLRKNPRVKIFLKNINEPLPVTLSYFQAERTEAGVILKWTTESELDNAGFNILRSETKNGEFKIVNRKLIQGAGTTSERQTYTWTDTTAKPNVVYYYQIEDISHAGVREQLATVRMRGYVSAAGKLTTKWGDLKLQE